MNIWVAVLPALVASIATTFLLSRRGHGRSTYRPDSRTVELSMPKARVTTVRIVAVSFPLLVPLVLLLSPRKADGAVIFVMTLLLVSVSGLFIWVAAVMDRKVVVSAEGVQVRGYRGWQQRWSDLVGLDAVSPGMDIVTIRFRNGRKVGVDSSFNGWLDLMKYLRSFTEDDANARTKVEAALGELNRWKIGADRN